MNPRRTVLAGSHSLCYFDHDSGYFDAITLSNPLSSTTQHDPTFPRRNRTGRTPVRPAVARSSRKWDRQISVSSTSMGWEIDFSVGVADRRQRFHAEFNTQENNRFTLLNPAPTRNPELLNRTNVSDSSAPDVIKIAMRLITKHLERPPRGPRAES